MADPLSGSSWSTPGTVESFSRSAPNATLLAVADAEWNRRPVARAVDIGCGAGRNAIPLALRGWTVLGVDLSAPMLTAAASRARHERVTPQLQLVLAPMDALPACDASADFVIAHGIWNLARSESEFRRAVREAARIARVGAAVFVFTFSRNTLPPAALPVGHASFVFTQFSGQPQCFLTEQQLIDELQTAQLTLDPDIPLRELTRRPPGSIAGGAPVIFEGVFRKAES